MPALLACILAACRPEAPSGVARFDDFTYEGKDAVYAAHPLSGEGEVYNPLLPGW